MITALYRIIKYGFKNFWRQRLISLATLTIILLAILVFQGLLIFNAMATSLLTSIQDKIDISVYFKTNAPEDEILRLKRSLEGLSEVKSVEYISRERALEIFKERHADDDDDSILRAIEELGENPLPASLNIKAYDPTRYFAIAAYLEDESLKPIVDKVSYSQNQVVIEKMASIIDISKRSGIILTILMTLVAIIVSFNTILLAIYSNREEIGIMRLVGASNAFIRGPFIVEGIIYGTLASLIALAITFPIVYVVSPYLQILSSDINLKAYFLDNVFVLFFYQLLFGIGIGIISSLIAIRKYLKI